MARGLEALRSMGFRRIDASPVPSEATRMAGGRYRLRTSRPSMGTLVCVIALHESRDLAEEAVGRAFREMDRVVDLLDRHSPNSAVSALNNGGVLRGPPPELTRVLESALACHRTTGGAFDPTVLPLVDRFRAPAASPSLTDLPSRREARELLELVDARAVELAPRSIRFGKGGMGVTLDGIAKGYVVDRMVATLLQGGLENFLLDAGGDIRAFGRREDGAPWRVGIQHPGKAGPFPDVLALEGMAVATSGGYETYLDPDHTHHHLVDPATGSSPGHTRSVSVVAPTAMQADALATAAFLLESRAAVALMDSLPRCACLIIHGDGRQSRSARWRSAAEPPPHKGWTP